MILLRVLLIANLLANALSLKFKIDLKTCEETKCFMLQECLYSGQPATTIDIYNGVTTLANSDCPLILQQRFLNNEKFLYVLQISKSLQAKKVEIYHGDKAILSCKEENGTIIVEPGNSTDLLQKLNLKPYEDLSRFDTDVAVCAFTMENTKLLMDDQVVDPEKKTSVRFDQEMYEYVSKGPDIFKPDAKKVLCDPDMIQDSNGKAGLRVLRVKHKDRISLDCSNYKNELGVTYDYDLYIEQEDIDPIMTTKLTCDKTKKLYTFNNGTHDVTLDDQFTAFCAVSLNKTCDTKPPCTGLCPTLTPPSNENNPKLFCEGGKWIIDGEYYKGLDPVCDVTLGAVPVFSLTLPDQSVHNLTNAQCFKEYNCMALGKFDITPCSAEKTDCSNVSIDGSSIHCENAEDDLMIFFAKEVRNDTLEFTCDRQDGFYKSTTDTSVTIAINSRISCLKKKEKENEPISAAQTVGYSVGAGVLSIVIVGGLTGLVFFLVFKRKHIKGNLVNMKRRDDWKMMSRDSKILEAKAVFGKAFAATLDQEVTILQGLKLMDTILECETEEPDVWDPLYRFIKRLQTVAFFKAYKLEKMFNRYCYLQARKIIDKHGWISKNQITKSNPTGYIRVCAIRLLTLARRDDIDAQRMVLEGFKKLRFNGFDQYPHCGLLWAVLTQQRIGITKLQTDLVLILFNMFDVKNVKPDFKDIPEEDQFEQFGSIKNQIAFAIGAAEATSYILCPSILMKKGCNDRLTQSLLDGIMYPTSGNTAAALFQKDSKTKKDSFPKYCKLMFDKPHLVEQAISTLIFKRNIRDAKTIWKKYKMQEKNKNSWDFCIAAKTSYQHFVDSLESENKSIIGWLSRSNGKEQRAMTERNKSKNELEEKTPKSNSSKPIEVKKGGSKTEKMNDEFIEKYVDAFGKEEIVKRITTSTLTAAEEAKLREMLQLLLSSKTLNGERAFFPIDDVIDVLHKATAIFESEPVFMEDVPAGISVVGDTHGQLYDLARIFDANAKDGKPGYETAKYLVLGDFVDRGPQILEIVLTLFILKILYPDRYFLLRGNHEFVSQNAHYHTYREVEERYNVFPAEFLFHKLNESCCYMPICAVIGGEIFCVHGGISASDMTREDLRKLRKPIYSTEEDSLINDLLWSDPHKGMQGFKYNPGRGTAIHYGEDFLQHALERLECSALIRGHQMIKPGYEIIFPNCLSIFSATAVDPTLNDAAFVRISEDLKYQIVQLKVDNIREDAIVATRGKKENDEVSCREGGVGFGSGEIDDFKDDDD